MKRYNIPVIIAIFMLTLSSCATLFNSKRSRLRIIADEPKEISFDKDTLNKFRTENQLDPNRDKSLLNHNPNEKHSNILKITPLKITGFVNPSIEVSHETRTGKSFSTQFMASYLLPSSVWNLGTGVNPGVKGLRVAVEEKFYLKRSAPLGRYVSVEFNYLKNQYKDIWYFGVANIYADSTSFNNYPDTFGVKKQTFSFNFKFGHQVIVKRLAFDYYVGFGLKYRDVTHFDRINPSDEMEIPRHPNVHYFKNLEGKSWTVSIPLNLRIGWTF